MDHDYSATVDEKIPQFKALAQSGKVDDALDRCFALEKQTRSVRQRFTFYCIGI